MSMSMFKRFFEKKKEGENQIIGTEIRLSPLKGEKIITSENQIEECEKKRHNQNFADITRKFGLNKYLKKDLSKDNQLDIKKESPSNDLFKEGTNLNEIRLENFLKEIQMMCDNYEKEIELLKIKSGNSTGTNTKNCPLCDKLINIIDNKKAVLNEKENELSLMKNEMADIKKKYDDLELHINSMMDDLLKFNENESNYSNMLSKELFKSHTDFHLDTSDSYRCANDGVRIELNANLLSKNTINEVTAFYPNEVLSHLIGRYIFNEYLSNISINLNSMNRKLLTNNNFISYLTTSFTNSRNTNFTLSIYHEYLQDIIIQIYITFRKIKQIQDKDNYSWLISEEDINDDIINATTEDIFNYYSDISNKSFILNLDDYFEKAFKKFNTDSQNYFKNLKKIVKENFMIQVAAYNQSIKDDIASLIKLCRNHIQAGKLFYRSSIMYDYWKLFHDATAFESGNKFLSEECNYENQNSLIGNLNVSNNKIFYYQSNETPDYSDYLINYIKFNSKCVDTIYIDGKILTSSDSNEEADSTFKLPISTILSSILINQDLIKKLKCLSITSTRLDDESVFIINKIIELSQNLISLDLSNNNLDSKYIKLVSESLKINNSISKLSLAYNNISSNATFCLSEMLLNSKIAILNLSGNKIKDLGLQSLVNILMNSNQTVNSLDLSNNNLEKDDLMVISNLIMKNCPHLQILNLSFNKFNFESVNSIGSALRTNTFIKRLYLNKIELNEDSTPYFMQHMMEFNLQDLHLDENSLGEVGGVLFANVIKNNHKLKTVSLRKTDQNSNSLSCISHALEFEIKKNGLKNIYLDENEFQDKEINNLVNIFKNHNTNGNGTYLPKIFFSASFLEEISINKLLTLELDNFILV